MIAAASAALALAAATTWSVRRPGWGAAALLAAACVAWLVLNGPLEGPVLLVVAAGHGLTLSDLLVPCAVLVSLLAAGHRTGGRR